MTVIPGDHRTTPLTVNPKNATCYVPSARRGLRTRHFERMDDTMDQIDNFYANVTAKFVGLPPDFLSELRLFVPIA